MSEKSLTDRVVKFAQAKDKQAAFAVLALWVAVLVRNSVPDLMVVAVVLYLSVFARILYDIYDKLAEKRKKRFRSHQDANDAIRAEIVSALGRKNCEIVWLGVTLQSAWLTLENALQPVVYAEKLNRLKLKLFQTSPSFLAPILPEAAAITAEQAKIVQGFAKRFCAELSRSQSEISLVQYDYMPNFHGILIDNKILFLSTVRWIPGDPAELSVPHEPFERIQEGAEEGAYMIALFKSWVEYAELRAKKLSTEVIVLGVRGAGETRALTSNG